MKTKKSVKTIIFILATFLILFNIKAISQEPSTFYQLRQFVNDFVSTTSKKGITTNTLRGIDIKGSPYLTAEFQTGNILTNQDVNYTGIPLRYNIYNDNIEFKITKDSILAISNPGMLKEIQFGGEKFVYCYDEFSKGKYYSQKTGGQAKVLIKYNIMFTDAEEPAPFQEAKPPRFTRKANTIFLKTDKGFPVQISSKKDLRNFYGPQADRVLSILKKEKLYVKKEADFIKLIQLIDKLN